MNKMAKVADSGSLSMSSQTASPADVLDGTPVATVLRLANRRVIAALDLGFLDEWMDNQISSAVSMKQRRSLSLHSDG